MGDEQNQKLASKAAYEDLFLRSLDAILLVELNHTGNILEVNDAAPRIFRVSAETLQKSNIYQYCKESERTEFQKMIRIASRRYYPKTFEVQLVVGTKDNPIEIIVEMAASPLKLNDGSEVLQLIYRDITEKKELERQKTIYLKKIEELAITDGMTGLTNFRQFKNLLNLEHERAARYQSTYSIIFCDIDHFKHYNDHHGHPAGDELLKKFAKILESLIRKSDLAARYGGEEFVILCPQTSLKNAKVLAERIRETVASTPFEYGDTQPLGKVSISIGISSFPQDGKDAERVLKTADKMLYSSKENGRNRVTLSSSQYLKIKRTKAA